MIRILVSILILFCISRGDQIFAQNIAINTTGTAAAAANMLEVTQSSTTNNRIGIFAAHSGAATNAYAIWAQATGATNRYAIVVPSGGGSVGIGTTTPRGLLNVRGYTGGTAGSAVAAFSENLVIGGTYNQSYNSGNAVLLHISDYSNDAGDNVYPIYVESENNNLAFFLNAGTTGGTGTAFFGGNVGLGTTTPSQLLHLGSIINSTDLKIQFTSPDAGSTTRNGWVYFDPDDNIVGFENGPGPFRIGFNSSGALNFSEMTSTTAKAGYGQLYVKSSDSQLYFMDDAGTESQLSSGVSGWTDGGTSIYNTTLTDKVGIGLIAPQTMLHIDGGTGLSDLANDKGYFVIGPVAGSNLAFDPNELQGRNNAVAADIFLQKNGGNVGIGTNTPAEKVEITGNLIFTKESARTISVATSTTASTAGANLTVKAGNAAATAVGGNLNLQGGTAAGFSTGGSVNISTVGSLAGGAINLTTGNSGLGGGNIVLTAGASSASGWPGQNIQLIGGAATGATTAGGSITLTPGVGTVGGSQVKIAGGVAAQRTATAASVTTNSEIIIGVTSTAAARTITLADVNKINGRIIIVKDESRWRCNQ